MTPQEAIASMIDRGITQAEIAKVCGISQGFTSKIAKGAHAKYETRESLVLMAKLNNDRKPSRGS